MKKIVLLFVLYALSTVWVYGSHGEEGPKVEIPPEFLQLSVSTENEVPLEKLYFLPGGTVGFRGAYVSAVVFDDKIKNCSVFIFSDNDLYGAYDGAPCEFAGAAEIDRARGTEVPDIYYKVNAFSVRLGASVHDVVAFYYDPDKKSFCESKTLATWRVNGRKNILPVLHDGICGAVK